MYLITDTLVSPRRLRGRGLRWPTARRELAGCRGGAAGEGFPSRVPGRGAIRSQGSADGDRPLPVVPCGLRFGRRSRPTVALANAGARRLLTPEELSRKTVALTGFDWLRSPQPWDRLGVAFTGPTASGVMACSTAASIRRYRETGPRSHVDHGGRREPACQRNGVPGHDEGFLPASGGGPQTSGRSRPVGHAHVRVRVGVRDQGGVPRGDRDGVRRRPTGSRHRMSTSAATRRRRG